MSFLERYLEDTEVNNKVIQRTLREIDEIDLFCVLTDLDELSSLAICRNLSKRANDAVMAELASNRNVYHPGRIKRARDEFLMHLKRFRKYETRQVAFIPSVSIQAFPSSPNQVIPFFYELSSRIAESGVDSCAGLSGLQGESLMRKGLEYLGDGMDPLLARALLERIKATRMRETELLLSMMIEGFDAIAAHDQPGLIAEKLQAFLPEADS